MDNGKDFASETIGGLTKQQRREARKATKSERESNESGWGGILGQLGIEAHFNIPYNKDGKGRVERLMRTVHQTFDNTFDTYRGSERIRVAPEHLKSILGNVMAMPTLEVVRSKFAEWVEWYNHRDEHNIEDLVDTDGITRISPDAFYESRVFRRDQLRDKKVLALLELPWSRPIKVTRSGVGMKIGGRTVSYGGADPAIKAIVGQTIRVTYDPADMTRVSVFHEDGRFIAEALLNSQHGGFNTGPIERASLEAAMRRQRDERRRISKPIDELAISGNTRMLAADEQRKRDIDAERGREAERRGKRDADDMPPIRLVSTPLDGEAEKAERAKQRMNARRAAGAESDAMPARPSFEEIFSDDEPMFAEPIDDAPARPSFEDVFGDDDEDTTTTPLRIDAIDAIDAAGEDLDEEGWS